MQGYQALKESLDQGPINLILAHSIPHSQESISSIRKEFWL
jgi:hypothetical protein